MKTIPTRILDRAGVCASVGCAIHCLVAPLVLASAPVLGGVWANPMTHVSIALLVLPVAAFALSRGFRVHRRCLIPVIGTVGMLLVLLGTIAPFLAESTTSNAESADVETAVVETACQECCPSLVTNEEDGTSTLKVPLASILTMLGGMALVMAHLGNLRCAAACCRETG